MIINALQKSIKKRGTFSSAKAVIQDSYDKELDICFGVDAAFIRPMGVAIVSLAEHNPGTRLRFHVFLGEIRENELLKLEELTRQYKNIIINLYDVDYKQLEVLPYNARMSAAVYFRILMPLVLKNAETILYLDVDIVCLGSIDGIINLDMEGKAAAVVLSATPTTDEQFEKMGVPQESYFNSGVMKIDIKQWNNQDLSNKTMEAKIQRQLELEDQNALNVALHGKVVHLPGKYNYSAYGDRSIPSDTAFLHYDGSFKPWRCTYQNEKRSYYMRYEKLSPWKDAPLELPINYPEARHYCKLLFRKGRLIEAGKWLIKLAIMRHNHKKQRKKLRNKGGRSNHIGDV